MTTARSPIEPRGGLTLRLIAKPRCTIGNFSIFGGWALSVMGQASGFAAIGRAQRRVDTVAIDATTFIIRPV